VQAYRWARREAATWLYYIGDILAIETSNLTVEDVAASLGERVGI